MRAFVSSLTAALAAVAVYGRLRGCPRSRSPAQATRSIAAEGMPPVPAKVVKQAQRYYGTVAGHGFVEWHPSDVRCWSCTGQPARARPSFAPTAWRINAGRWAGQALPPGAPSSTGSSCAAVPRNTVCACSSISLAAGLTMITRAPLRRASWARPAAGHTAPEVPTTSSTRQLCAACWAARMAASGNISPNQTTPGRMRLPHAQHAGGRPGRATQRLAHAPVSSHRSSRMSPCRRTASRLPAR